MTVKMICNWKCRFHCPAYFLFDGKCSKKYRLDHVHVLSMSSQWIVFYFCVIVSSLSSTQLTPHEQVHSGVLVRKRSFTGNISRNTSGDKLRYHMSSSDREDNRYNVDVKKIDNRVKKSNREFGSKHLNFYSIDSIHNKYDNRHDEANSIHLSVPKYNIVRMKKRSFNMLVATPYSVGQDFASSKTGIKIFRNFAKSMRIRKNINEDYDLSMENGSKYGISENERLQSKRKETVSQRYVHDINPEIDVVQRFLEQVESYEKNKFNCTAGTSHNLGEGVIKQYGLKRFKAQALVTVNRANFLTRIWKTANDAILSSENFFYAQVRNLVEGDSEIFAAGNCYDIEQYKDYYLFCPYAHRLPDGKTINVKDLSVEYDYLANNGTEWFETCRHNAQVVNNVTVGK